ncbi:MAG: FG-GAP-like repeat-containing protein, partial [Prochlorothrix sp.]
TLLPRSHTAGVDLGDLDGDGDLDMVLGSLANIYDTPDFFVGALGGTPTLADPNNPDFDGQGFNTVWKNDGSGNFTLWQNIEPNVRSAVMKLGDVDGDGDLDALSANLGPGLLSGEESERTTPYGFAPNYSNRNLPGGNQLWINDGTGTFTKGQLIGNDITNGVEFADFDGDGDLDIWEANFGTAYGVSGTAERVWLNDGSGNFTDSGQLFPNGVSANVAFGDLNGDGALDVFVANFAYTESSRVYLNSIDSSKPEASVNTDTNVVAVSKSTNLKFKLTQVNTTAVKEVGFFVVRDNNGTITDEDGNSLTPADAGYTAAAMQQATVLFAALGNNPAGFDPLGFDRIVGALGGSADVFAGGAKLVFYFVQEGSTDSRAAGNNSGSVLFGTTFESNAFGASANLTITSLGNGKFSLSWLDNLTLTLESTDDDLPFGSGLQGRNQLGILDLTGLEEDIRVEVTVYREAAFDNLVGFYVIDDITGTVAGASVGSSDYVAKALANRITSLDLLKVGNGASETFNGVLGKGQYLAPFIIVNGTLDEALAGNADVYFPFLGSNSDGGTDHVRLLGNNVFGFEDLAGGGDNDFQDLIVQIKAA